MVAKKKTKKRPSTVVKKKKIVIIKDANNKFAKGISANPNGRPKGGKNSFSISDLREAIKKVEKRKKKKLYVHFVERAYQEDNVLIALMKKLIYDAKPDPDTFIPDAPVDDSPRLIGHPLTMPARKGPVK